MIARAIVVGTGAVANFCADELKKRAVAVSFVESRQGVAAGSEKFCLRKQIPHQQLEKVALTDFLKSIKEKTLIVSASNRYLFPAAVLENPALTIVNYHGALLPKFPGRNAEAWAIFSKETKGGITWHYVVKDVDAGLILVQKSVDITDKTTSFTLLREYAKLAQEGFVEIIDALLGETASGSPQQGVRGEVRYSWMKPNGGVLNDEWNAEQMSAFLRAFDYGPLETLGRPTCCVNRTQYEIKSYAIRTLDAPNDENDSTKIVIEKDPYRFVLDVIPIKKGE